MLRNLVFAGSAFTAAMANSFDWTMANITLYHSQNTYCDPTSYEDRNYHGVLEGFVPTYTIDDDDHDTHGYVGYHTGQKNIYVAFRGSESIQNWVDNLDVKLTDYPLCDGCEVHDGFYRAMTHCYDDVLKNVQQLQSQYPSYSVVVTGHSLGAALSLLTGLNLMDSGINNVMMWNYGSPRVGNTELATYASSKMSSHHRVTHHKDMVVHVPMHERFTHIDGEWYQPDDSITIQECSGFEDHDCSYQWHITSIDDHLYYLGLHLGVGDGSNCDYFLQ